MWPSQWLWKGPSQDPRPAWGVLRGWLSTCALSLTGGTFWRENSLSESLTASSLPASPPPRPCPAPCLSDSPSQSRSLALTQWEGLLGAAGTSDQRTAQAIQVSSGPRSPSGLGPGSSVLQLREPADTSWVGHGVAQASQLCVPSSEAVPRLIPDRCPGGGSPFYPRYTLRKLRLSIAEDPAQGHTAVSGKARLHPVPLHSLLSLCSAAWPQDAPTLPETSHPDLSNSLDAWIWGLQNNGAMRAAFLGRREAGP